MTASGVLLGLRPSRLTPYCFVTKADSAAPNRLTGLGGAAVVNTSSKCKRYRSSNFMKRGNDSRRNQQTGRPAQISAADVRAW